MTTTTLDSFEVTNWAISDGVLFAYADGETTISAWDPQDETIAHIADAYCEIDLDCLQSIPASTEEVAKLMADAEWDISTAEFA